MSTDRQTRQTNTRFLMLTILVPVTWYGITVETYFSTRRLVVVRRIFVPYDKDTIRVVRRYGQYEQYSTERGSDQDIIVDWTTTTRTGWFKDLAPNCSASNFHAVLGR